MVKEDFKEEVPLSGLERTVCVARVQGNQGIVSTTASAENSKLGQVGSLQEGSVEQ